MHGGPEEALRCPHLGGCHFSSQASPRLIYPQGPSWLFIVTQQGLGVWGFIPVSLASPLVQEMGFSSWVQVLRFLLEKPALLPAY